MAVLFIDGFDHYTTDAQALTKWSLWGVDWNITAGVGRFGSAGARNSAGANATISATLPSALATVLVGFACKAPADASSYILLGLYDGATEQLSVRVQAATGRLQISRAGTTLATSTFAVSNVYVYIELKATISDAAGSYDLRVNGVSVLSASGVDTKNTANASVNSVRFGISTNVAEFDIDDVYIADTTGAAPNNDLLGDVRVETIQPTAAGNSTQFTPSTGANYTTVDEASPSTADFVTSTADNQTDTYTFGNLSSTPTTVHAVAVRVYASKTDAAAKSLAIVTRPASTDHVSADMALSTSSTYYSEIRSLNPETSAAWTGAEVNATEWGVKSRP